MSLLCSIVLSGLLMSCASPTPVSHTPPPPIEETPALEEPQVTFCTEEYMPVCAKRQVQCIAAPCDPVEQTYPNRCYAERDGGYDITDGACAF